MGATEMRNFSRLSRRANCTLLIVVTVLVALSICDFCLGEDAPKDAIAVAAWTARKNVFRPVAQVTASATVGTTPTGLLHFTWYCDDPDSFVLRIAVEGNTFDTYTIVPPRNFDTYQADAQGFFIQEQHLIDINMKGLDTNYYYDYQLSPSASNHEISIKIQKRLIALSKKRETFAVGWLQH
jgi:hypothetical protein